MPQSSNRSGLLIAGLSLTAAMLIAERAPTAAAKPVPGSLVIAALSEEKLPAEELPSSSPSAGLPATQSSATPAASDESGDADDSGDEEPVNSDQTGTTATPAASATVSTGQAANEHRLSSAATVTPTPAGPPPALDLSTAGIAPDLGAISLEPEIRKAATPSRAASIRVTESARKELAAGSSDAALRDLARAVSIDPGNSFAYYYLGRAYLARRNYSQALTFFQRAELGFGTRPDWLGETLSYEGACDEQLGRRDDAAKAYQRAVAAAPGNFRAQAGYGRLGPVVAPVANFDLPPPVAGDAALPPPVSVPAPPPEEQPAPPPAGSDN